MSISAFWVVIEALVRDEFLNVEVEAENSAEGGEFLVKSSEEEHFVLFFGGVERVVEDESFWDRLVGYFRYDFEDVRSGIVVAIFVSF